MCLSIGTPKNNEFSIVPNGKLIIFRCLKFWGKLQPHYDRFHIGTPKTINFPFGTNGKSMVLSVPILKHFRVYCGDPIAKFNDRLYLQGFMQPN